MVSVPCKPSAVAAEKYADAVESIPLALAENAGMSVIDTQAELRTRSKEAGKARYGIDVFKGKVADLSTRDIYEPLTVKNQVINSATEAACMILRIDNIISASAPKSGGPPPGSPYGGMPDTYRQYNICVSTQKWWPTTKSLACRIIS